MFCLLADRLSLWEFELTVVPQLVLHYCDCVSFDVERMFLAEDLVKNYTSRPDISFLNVCYQ